MPKQPSAVADNRAVYFPPLTSDGSSFVHEWESYCAFVAAQKVNEGAFRLRNSLVLRSVSYVTYQSLVHRR